MARYAISLPVCGREVKFTLEVLGETLLRPLHAYGQAMGAIRNYLPKMLWMISFLHFLLTGQPDSSFLAAGFPMSLVRDSSRRRKAAILTESDYRILVGELDDEQNGSIVPTG